MKKSPLFKLSIVIPTFNRKESLIRVLAALKNQAVRDIETTVIVVVDGSTDGTREAVRASFPGVSLVEGDGNWWWTRSVNEGCKRALQNGANAVLLLNDDTGFAGNYLDTLYRAAQTHPQAIIGSLNLTAEEDKRIFFSGADQFQWWCGKLRRYHPFLSPYNQNLTGLHKSIVLPGRGVWIPAAVFRETGYFDEKSLPQYKADYEFVYRAYKHHIQTLISWEAVVFVDVKATGKGATFTGQKLWTFLSSPFRKNSRTNLYHNFQYYKKIYPLWALPLFPFAVLLILGRQILEFIKNKKY